VLFGSLHMKAYGEHDLSAYSSSRCREWASRGVPDAIKAIAKEHPFRSAVRVRTCEEARAAIQNGYCINICSGQGFKSRRDDDGFAQASGSWPHSMSLRAYRGGTRRGFLIQNSWGNGWITGPIWPEDMPQGSFWCSWDTMARILRQGDSFAYSNYDGFQQQNIDWGSTW
jgi:hypothetical protein